MPTKIKNLTALSTQDFRGWLKKNHDKENKVAVVLYKKHTGKTAPSHRELMEEAICFGWIDTTIKRLDENKFIRYFSRRNKNSKWSDNTLGYAKQLIKERRMTPAGLKFYKEGLKKPTHDAGIPKNPHMPLALKKALAKNKRAKTVFDKYPPSSKRMLFRWLLSAKLPQTRAQRIEKIIKSATEHKKVF